MLNETPQAAQQNARFRGQVSKEISTKPPIGGWNTRDAVGEVPEEDALVLDNWTPELRALRVRRGYVPHAYSHGVVDHTAGSVKTLMKYDSGAESVLLAADGGAIWDATIAGLASKLDEDGFTSDVWSWTMFRGGAAPDAQLVMVNGTALDQRTYEPSAELVAFTLTNFDGGAAPVPIGCYAFKNRMYYWEEDSQSIWYTELYAQAGDVHEFPVGTIGVFGGKVVSIESVTHDGGRGTDDYLLIFMSSGEVIAYQGSYPADEADWALVGIYNPGKPMGPQGFAKFGGDLYMMTDLDILPMSALLKGQEADKNLTKISGAMQRVAYRRGTFGFQVEFYPASRLMIFNVPTDDSFEQFVMNTVTGAWARWMDIDSSCWIEFQGDLYFGSENVVV